MQFSGGSYAVYFDQTRESVGTRNEILAKNIFFLLSLGAHTHIHRVRGNRKRAQKIRRHFDQFARLAPESETLFFRVRAKEYLSS